MRPVVVVMVIATIILAAAPLRRFPIARIIPDYGAVVPFR